jgi:hypothetical protein
VKKITLSRVRKALKHRVRKILNNSKPAASQSFSSPTALRLHAITTQAVGNNFAYTIALPKNFQISNPNLQIGNLQQFSIKLESSNLHISASFSQPMNEGYFAWAVARMISPSLVQLLPVSPDFKTQSLESAAGKRLALGPIASTDAAEMELTHIQAIASVPGQFDIALFNPIGLKLKKALETPRIAQVELDTEFRLNGAVRKVDEFLIAELRGYAGGQVALKNPALAHLVTGLAATGLVLEVHGDLHVLHPKLQEILASPLPQLPNEPSGVLAWFLRSETQRRIALLHHSGVWANGDFPTVDILLVTNRAQMLPTALSQIAEQTYANFRIRVGAHNLSGAELDEAVATAVQNFGDRIEIVEFPADATLGEIYGELTRDSQAEFIAKFDDDDFYGPNHLLDAIISLQYSGAGLFGRTPNLTWLETSRELLLRPFGDEETYNKYIIGPTMVIRRSALLAVGGWRPTPWAVDKALIDRFQQLGGGIYRAGAFGWIYVRHDQGHTWLRDESHFRNQAEHVWNGTEALELKTKVLGLETI